MLPKHDLRHDGALPVPLSIHQFNFNANDIMGNVEAVKNPKTIKVDKNKRKVNKFNFLCDNNGHIINRNKRKILDKAYLEKTGDFPALLTYKGDKYHIKEVVGNLQRDKKTGNAVMRKDNASKKFIDRRGRFVNKRGYLTDN
jgi:hypothetical protein